MACDYVGVCRAQGDSDPRSQLFGSFAAPSTGGGAAGATHDLRAAENPPLSKHPAYSDIDSLMQVGCEDWPFHARGNATRQWATQKLKTNELVNGDGSMLGLNTPAEVPTMQNRSRKSWFSQHDEECDFDMPKLNISRATQPPLLSPQSNFPMHKPPPLAEILGRFVPPDTNFQLSNGVPPCRGATCAHLMADDQSQSVQAIAKLSIDRWVQEGIQTLMVRNIPVRYTQDLLMDEWRHVNSYDFLYLPMRIAENRNSSFAFINFVNPQQAVAFARRWQKERPLRFKADKPLDIRPAHVQGLDANLLQAVRSKANRIKAMNFQPAVFWDNKRVPLDVALAEVESRHAVEPAFA